MWDKPNLKQEGRKPSASEWCGTGRSHWGLKTLYNYLAINANAYLTFLDNLEEMS
jgi:hypothetical protein